MQRTRDICFIVDKPLGKLSKWLRILGFDTIYELDDSKHDRPMDLKKEKRIRLSCTISDRNRMESNQILFIVSNDSFEQLKQVIHALGINLEDIRPFSRCNRCNTLIKPVDKDSIRGIIPDYIWETHTNFRFCCYCQKIYWPGNHTKEGKEIIKRLFNFKPNGKL